MSMKKSDEVKWDEAINDAKKKIKKLQATIATFEEKKTNGEPWPRTSAYTVTRERDDLCAGR